MGEENVLFGEDGFSTVRDIIDLYLLEEEIIKHQKSLDSRIIEVLKRFDDDRLVSLLEKAFSRDLQVFIVSAMKSLELKEKYMQEIKFSEGEMHTLACHSSCDVEILKIILKIDNEILYSHLVYRLKSNPIITDFFWNRTLEEQKKLISILPNDRLKVHFLKKYLEVLDFSFIQKIINSIRDEKLKNDAIFFSRTKKSDNTVYVKSYGEEDALPSDLKFGVEIEAAGAMSLNLLGKSGYLFGSYEIKEEGSVSSGVELTSPILQFDDEHLKGIYDVCKFLKENDFEVNFQCGGHIHFSSNYLKTFYEWFLLYYLYTKLERIFFIISNRCGCSPRTLIDLYAFPIGKDFVETFEDINSVSSADEFIDIVQGISEYKSDAVNIKNIGTKMDTIEFRIPNGDIEANIIIENVLLFGNLIVLAKRLAMLPHSKEVYTLLKRFDEATDEEEILEIFLKMAFKSSKNREIFRKRYKANAPLFELCSKEFGNSFKCFSLKSIGQI